MSAHISGKEVESAYINGKQVLQIYDSGKLVWCKYFPIGYQMVINKIHGNDKTIDHINVYHSHEDLGMDEHGNIIWGSNSYCYTDILLSNKTWKKISPNSTIKVQYRTSSSNVMHGWIDENTYPKKSSTPFFQFSIDNSENVEQVKLTIV